MTLGELRIFSDVEALSQAAARRWVELAEKAVAARGKFHVALSGGTTPAHLYRHLAAADLAGRVAWDRVHVYFGDERTVAPDHPESNYRMACEALLDHVPLPRAQIFRIEGEAADHAAAATRYAQTLSAKLPMSAQGVVQFDLVLLGLGADGHVASLFPATPILHERARFADAVYVEKLGVWRISITLPVIEHARGVMMLVSGENKAKIIQEVFTDRRAPPYPVQLIHPRGAFEWYMDAAAAGLLPAELRS